MSWGYFHFIHFINMPTQFSGFWGCEMGHKRIQTFHSVDLFGRKKRHI